MKTVVLPAGERVPAFGMGTWRMAEDRARRAEEIATLRLGLDRGATLIDTAEMYGEGHAEQLVGEAIAGRRDEVFLVTKVYPHNASRTGMPRACERSLKRLGTDRIDLYLLHWRGSIALEESMQAFADLQRDGKIRHYGVSNLDLADLKQVSQTSSGGAVQADQLLYNLTRRALEWDLLPWLREQGIPVMAYSPVEEGRLLCNARLARFARDCDRTPAQVALAWLLARPDVIVIPKTARRDRLLENLASLERPLDAGELTELDRLFPPPRGPAPLEMI
ncbi:MAG TPA: aldo/keto reductase [Steroidobacteraceae bacterium]|nr:aldo/keto reductase [Steroidobacteraceae bacterium]